MKRLDFVLTEMILQEIQLQVPHYTFELAIINNQDIFIGSWKLLATVSLHFTAFKTYCNNRRYVSTNVILKKNRFFFVSAWWVFTEVIEGGLKKWRPTDIEDRTTKTGSCRFPLDSTLPFLSSYSSLLSCFSLDVLEKQNKYSERTVICLCWHQT